MFPNILFTHIFSIRHFYLFSLSSLLFDLDFKTFPLFVFFFYSVLVFKWLISNIFFCTRKCIFPIFYFFKAKFFYFNFIFYKGLSWLRTFLAPPPLLHHKRSLKYPTLVHWKPLAPSWVMLTRYMVSYAFLGKGL